MNLPHARIRISSGGRGREASAEMVIVQGPPGNLTGHIWSNGQNCSQWDMSVIAPHQGSLQAGSGLWVKGFMPVRMVGETRPGDL